MAKLLMITGLGSAKDLASGKRGAFYYTLEEFSKHWDRIDIIAPRIPNHKSGIINLFGNVYVHISSWPLILHPFWFIKKGLEIYKEQKFDLMTVQEFPPFYNGIGARLLWNKIRVPYILEIHHIPGYPMSASIKEEVYKNLSKLFLEKDSSRASAVRIVNQNQAFQFLIESGVPKEKIIHVPSMYIDLDIFKPLNLPKEYDLIFIGRLVENKGVSLFLDVVKNLNCRAIIIGDGPLKNKLELRATSHNMQVTFYGWARDQKEIVELLNKSKILIMPSYNEGGPRVVPEALACGVPVLATPVGIVPDLLNNNQGGEIIDWDGTEIADRVKIILNSPDLYEKYSKKGPEIAGQFERRGAIKNYADKIKEFIK